MRSPATQARSEPAAPERLSREAILRAATKMVDEDGLDGLTMRKLGQVLGVDGSAFYHYFKGKSDLLRVLGRVSVSLIEIPDIEAFPTWRDWFVQVGVNYRQTLIERSYLRELILSGHVAWNRLPLYEANREQLLADGVPDSKHHLILEAAHAFVLGSATLATSPVIPGMREDATDSKVRETRDREFLIAFRVLLDALIASMRS